MSEFYKIFILVLLGIESLMAAPFPTDKWSEATLSESKFDEKKFARFVDYNFSSEHKHKTDGIVIIHKGKLVFEKYANEYDAQRLHLFWSASKSVTSMLVGILVKEGTLSIDEKISKFYPDAKGITVKHLLNMSSSLDWSEGYESNPLNSNVIQMLYTSGRPDMASYTSKIKPKGAPGEIFKYSSGETNLLMGFVKKKIANDEYFSNLPWEKIFSPLGIKKATWERDPSGTFVGSSYLYLTPRDFARIGYLYLREGNWNGVQLITKDWVDFSRKMAPAFPKTTLDGFDNNESYGAQWWLNLPIAKKGLGRPYPDAPEDLYMALGHHGQMVGVIPSKDLVIVRTAEDKEGPIDKNEFYKLLLESIEK
jgi:CubicO group peptidase (beta-lactamase class C family)